MTSNRLKNLARLRLILSVIAVLLAGVMVFSGVMYFLKPSPAPSGEEPAESVAQPAETLASEPTQTPESPEISEPSQETEATEPEASTSPDEDTEDLSQDAVRNPFDPMGIFGSTAEDPTTAPVEDTTPRSTQGNNWGNDNNNHNNHNNQNTHPTTPPTNPTIETTAPESNATEPAVGATVPESTATEPAETAVPESIATEPAETTIPESIATEPAAEVAVSEGTPSESAEYIEIVGGTVYEFPEETEMSESTDTAPDSEIAETPEKAEGLNIRTGSDEEQDTLWLVVFLASGGLLIVDLIVIMILSSQIKQEKNRLQRVRKSLSQTDEHARHPVSSKPVQPVESTQLLDHSVQIGTVHQMGRREYQQDSLGHTIVLDSQGILAVVADGMGGLSGGEKVSQKIVMDAMEMGRQLKPNQTNGVLWKMVDVINNNVNQMLGPDGLYKSGSTMLAVLAHNGKFQWIAVGDSRIYLYRQGYANQLNHDHDQLQVWMADVLSGRRSMEEVLRNPEGKKLTSFIGMGQLKYIDGSRGAIPLEPGDRLVLMSDGVYNVVNEAALAGVLSRYPDVNQAASVIDRMIRENNHPHQDNYTAIVLGF